MYSLYSIVNIFLLASQTCCVLYLWTINGRLVNTLRSSTQILSLCYTSAPEGVHVNVIIGGLANGKIK